MSTFKFEYSHYIRFGSVHYSEMAERGSSDPTEALAPPTHVHEDVIPHVTERGTIQPVPGLNRAAGVRPGQCGAKAAKERLDVWKTI